MDYIVHITILVAIYTILGQSLNLILGYAGILSFAQASFFAIGAYVAGLLSVHAHAPLELTLVIACGTGGMLAILLSLPSVNVKGDCFALITFGFQVLIWSFLNNATGLTGGASGLPGIHNPVLLGYEIVSRTEYLVVSVVAAMLVTTFIHYCEHSPFGRILLAIREDELFAESLGKDTRRAKLTAFGLSGAIAASAGVLYAHDIAYIDPTSFDVGESVFIIAILALGGVGTIWGPVLGATTLVLVPEALRFVALSGAVGANLRQIFYGTVLIGVVFGRPQGIVGRHLLR